MEHKKLLSKQLLACWAVLLVFATISIWLIEDLYATRLSAGESMRVQQLGERVTQLNTLVQTPVELAQRIVQKGESLYTYLGASSIKSKSNSRESLLEAIVGGVTQNNDVFEIAMFFEPETNSPDLKSLELDSRDKFEQNTQITEFSAIRHHHSNMPGAISSVSGEPIVSRSSKEYLTHKREFLEDSPHSGASDWFRGSWSRPQKVSGTSVPVSHISVPMFSDDDKFIGITSVGWKLSALRRVLGKENALTNRFSFLISPEHSIFMGGSQISQFQPQPLKNLRWHEYVLLNPPTDEFEVVYTDMDSEVPSRIYFRMLKNGMIFSHVISEKNVAHAAKSSRQGHYALVILLVLCGIALIVRLVSLLKTGLTHEGNSTRRLSSSSPRGLLEGEVVGLKDITSQFKQKIDKLSASEEAFYEPLPHASSEPSSVSLVDAFNFSLKTIDSLNDKKKQDNFISSPALTEVHSQLSSMLSGVHHAMEVMRDTSEAEQRCRLIGEVQTAASNSRRLLAAVQTLTTVSNTPPQLNSFALKDVVEKIYEDIIGSHTSLKCSASLLFDPLVPPRSRGPLTQIEQSVLSLLQFAIDHAAQESHIALSVRRGPHMSTEEHTIYARVTIETPTSASEVHKRAVVLVSDLDSIVAPDIFLSPELLHAEIARRSIQSMGGKLAAEITAQSSIVFSFSLNLATDRKNPLALSVTSTMEKSSKEPIDTQTRILVVDDNRVNSNVLRRFLERRNYNVSVVEGGLEAYKELTHRPFDLVLMDLMMADVSGDQVTHMIRTSGTRFQNIPIVAVTAASRSHVALRCRQKGMNGFISKPIDPEVLFSTIESCLDRPGHAH